MIIKCFADRKMADIEHKLSLDSRDGSRFDYEMISGSSFSILQQEVRCCTYFATNYQFDQDDTISHDAF